MTPHRFAVLVALSTILHASATSAHERTSRGEADAAEDVADGGPKKSDDDVPKTIVTARRSYAAASATTIRNEELVNVPIQEPADLLQLTPGLFTVQHAGGGKASQYFLRGFDIDHGTDLALSVDGVPVNLVSHAHGQGYADLHFVIPETVDRIEVSKGPYSAKVGDFATAGAINLVTRSGFNRSSAEISYGSFDTFRGLLIAAPPTGETFQSYAAAEIYGSDGPFVHPDRLRRFNFLGRGAYRPTSNTELTLQLTGYGSGWNASGQIPLRAVTAGKLGRFDSIDPSDGGNTERYSALLTFHHRDEMGGQWTLLAYAVRYRFDLFSDFTFFARDPVNGDQIEQTDLRTMTGFEARYERKTQVRGIQFVTSGGVCFRNDDIDNGLFHTTKRERLDQQVGAQIGEGSLGAFVQADTEWLSWLRTVLGLRGDGFGLQVSDRPGNLATTNSVRASGNASAMLVSPKASLVLTPRPELSVYMNYGRGFHSNDARGVVREVDPVTPLAAATGYELGLRAEPLSHLNLTLAAWALDLQSEIVWEGDEGTTEARPATRRRGIEAQVQYRFTSWLRADAEATWSRARFTQMSEGGFLVPLAPTWTWTGGIAAKHPSGLFVEMRLLGMANRPANETATLIAQGFTVVNAEIGYETRRFRVACSALNLFNVPWRQAQFANQSRLPNEPAPVEDIYFTPGYPLTLLASVSAYL